MNTAYNPTNIVQDGIFCFLIQDIAMCQKISHNFSDAEKKKKKRCLPWTLLNAQPTVSYICFVRITIYTSQLPDADSPRVLGTYPFCFDLY